jgi:hypothetical protein
MSRIQATKDYLLHTADQLEKGTPFTTEQMQFWANIFRRIGEGESPDMVLNLKRKKGEKSTDDLKRQKISLVLHLIASYYRPHNDPRLPPEPKFSLEEAIEKVLPSVQKIMGDKKNYDFELVRSWWYDVDKKHMNSAIRTAIEPDTPFRKVSRKHQ